MAMSKKHYEAIAEALKNNFATSDLILDLAEIFENDNSSFDVSRFLKASR